MTFRDLFSDDYLLWEALGLSALLHLGLFHVSGLTYEFHQKHIVEIDITNMGHIGTPGPARQTATPAPPKPIAKPKEWVKPAPNQKVAPAPIPTQPVPAPLPEEVPPPSPAAAGTGTGEYGIGTGDGSANILSRIPQLLNLSDLSAILRRFYPEEARSQGRQATVVLDLHIDTDGHVTSTDIVQSGGSDFDQAAKKAAMLLRFTPAFLGSQRVNVKMRQAIQFKLEE
jgi:periplasmic protein TonB